MPYCDSSYARLIEDRYYDALLPLSSPLRAAEKFRLGLENQPVWVSGEEPFLGWFGPAERVDTQSLRCLPPRYTPSEEERQWLGYPPSVGRRICVDKAHTCIRYERILREGLCSQSARVEEALARDPENEYLVSMKIALEAVRTFTLRLGVEAEAKGCGRLADRIRRVPWGPSVDFADALQAVWLIHFLIPLAENAWYSISLGRMDDYLLPYYRKSIADGITPAEGKELLRFFWQLLNSYSDAACLVNVGPMYNELSALFDGVPEGVCSACADFGGENRKGHPGRKPALPDRSRFVFPGDSRRSTVRRAVVPSLPPVASAKRRLPAFPTTAVWQSVSPEKNSTVYGAVSSRSTERWKWRLPEGNCSGAGTVSRWNMTPLRSCMRPLPGTAERICRAA